MERVERDLRGVRSSDGRIGLGSGAVRAGSGSGTDRGGIGGADRECGEVGGELADVEAGLRHVAFEHFDAAPVGEDAGDEEEAEQHRGAADGERVEAEVDRDLLAAAEVGDPTVAVLVRRGGDRDEGDQAEPGVARERADADRPTADLTEVVTVGRAISGETEGDGGGEPAE